MSSALTGGSRSTRRSAGWDAIEPEIDRILAEGRAAPGHIFNLGHGVPPDADPEVLRRITKYVQAAHVPA